MFKKRVVKNATKRLKPTEDILKPQDGGVGKDIGTKQEKVKHNDISKKVSDLISNQRSQTNQQTKTNDTIQQNQTNEPPETEDSLYSADSATKQGPKPIPANIRTTTITDFQPDVCKDFLQTGYCGYGDTCKFLHIRDELKQKKVIDKDWETVGKTLAKKEKEMVPFKCVLCKQDYKNPVRTVCGHIYCLKCFFTRSKKKSKCFICGTETEGSVKPVSQTELNALIL